MWSCTNAWLVNRLGADLYSNILPRATNPTPQEEPSYVYDALTRVAGLLVLCPFMQEDKLACARACMGTTLTAMRIAIHVHPNSQPLLSAQPSCLATDEVLKHTSQPQPCS